MNPEDLTPADREIAQLALIRIHLGRRRRVQYAIARGPVTRLQIGKRYDVRGYLIGVDGIACEPHQTTAAEERQWTPRTA